MHRTLCFCLVTGLLLATARRSPAPITELPENPTPAPEQASKPKLKRSARSKSTPSNNEKASAKAQVPSGPAKFAGNWSGTISQGVWGNVKVPLVINADGSSVKMTAGDRPATVNGNTITWKSGLFSEITWTLTPQGNGRTADVTSNSGLGVNAKAVFTRTDMPSLTAPTVKPTAVVGAAHFAGTWSGTIGQGLVGAGPLTLTLNAAGTEVKEKSSYTSVTRHSTCDGKTANWRGGAFDDLAWTLTPNPDGQTAIVTTKSVISGTSTATFNRTHE